jgi:hypothetical protein
MRGHSWLWTGVLLALGLVSWWAVDLWATAQETPNPPGQPNLGFKVFRLNFTEPDEMKTVLEHVFELVPRPAFPALGGALGNVGMPTANAVGGAGIMGIGGGGVMGMGALGMMGGPPAPMASIAVDQRTRAVVVRTSDREMKVAADVVAVLDTAAGKPLPRVKHIGVFVLKHADPEELKGVLEQIGIGVVALVPAKLVITPDLNALPDLDTAIQELDVPTRPPLPPEKRKRLVLDPGQ